MFSFSERVDTPNVIRGYFKFDPFLDLVVGGVYRVTMYTILMLDSLVGIPKRGIDFEKFLIVILSPFSVIPFVCVTSNLVELVSHLVVVRSKPFVSLPFDLVLDVPR